MADPIINQSPKELDYKQKDVVKEDGLREQQAVEVTKPKSNITNTITVEEVKELVKKSESVGPTPEPVDLKDYSKIHNFEEGTILTDEILAEVKSGDILKVNQMEFIVNNKPNESPRVITGSSVGSTGTILVLNWVKGQALSPELKPISSMTLLATTLWQYFEPGEPMKCEFIIDPTKITSKTILIFTYANCFVMTPLSQTGESRTLGNLVYDGNGNSNIAKIKFNLSGSTLIVETNLVSQFDGINNPTAYLFAFSVI